MEFQNSAEYAEALDSADPLREYRSQFYVPTTGGKEVIYFTGNSLGLQPRLAEQFVGEILTDWKEMAVEGHFHADKPWWDYHERLAPLLSKIVGARTREVSVMNTLTVNLHLLMVSFYRPTTTRYKILCEEKAFPSDQYMLQSQLRFHGLDPADALVEIGKRPGEHGWRTEDILAKIREVGDALALVFLGGVNYYNGQVLDMKAITRTGRDVGAMVGWDLAHAAGNVQLELHDWEVDFAAWCSYKYMNSGPGNASGVFIHERHLNQSGIQRFEGWWGNRKESRFLMKPEFEPIDSADAWQLSNPAVLSLAPYLASLMIFEKAGMQAIIEKRDKIVAYLEFVLKAVASGKSRIFEIITPEDRGCQLSILLHGQGKPLFNYLTDHGVVTDWREPNVMRLAPVPLYTRYVDIQRFGELLKEGIDKV